MAGSQERYQVSSGALFLFSKENQKMGNLIY